MTSEGDLILRMTPSREGSLSNSNLLDDRRRSRYQPRIYEAEATKGRRFSTHFARYPLGGMENAGWVRHA